MKTATILLITLVSGLTALTLAAQESREGLARQLGELYGPPVAETFLVPSGALLQARYSAEGLACSLAIQPESQFLSDDLAHMLLDQFVASEERQRRLQSFGLSTGCGGSSSDIYPLVTVSRSSRCEDAGEVRLGNDGQPCRMLIERPTLSRSALFPGEAEKILAGLPPLADAGPPLEASSLDVWECVDRERADYADFSVEVEHSSCASSGGLGVTRIVIEFVSDRCPAGTERRKRD